MLTVNMPVNILARIIRQLATKQPENNMDLVNQLSHMLYEQLESKEAEQDKPGVIKLTPKAKKAMDNLTLQLMGSHPFDIDRMIVECLNPLPKAGDFVRMKTPLLWPTPDWLGIDKAAPNGDATVITVVKPAIESLHKIAKALNDFEPAWQDKTPGQLIDYIITVIGRDRDISRSRNHNLAERFNLLEKIKTQVGAKTWADIPEINIKLRNILKALPGEHILDAATRQMKNADYNANGAEILAHIVADLNLQPGDDIGVTITNLKQRNVELESLRESALESADYRLKCLNEIADILDLKPGVRTPAYVVEAVGVLVKMAKTPAPVPAPVPGVIISQDDVAALRRELYIANRKLSDIKGIVNSSPRSANSDWARVGEILEQNPNRASHELNAETTLALIRSVMRNPSLGGEVQRQRVLELLK